MYDDTKPESNNSGLVRASYDPEETESLSVTIVEAVAKAKGISAENLDDRLFDVVDPDALDRLFRPTDAMTNEAEVRFIIDNHAVVIQNTGDVFVRPLE